MTPDDVLLVVLKLGLIVVLVLLNGFFVAAEFAIVKVRDTQLEGLANAGDRRARRARKVIGHLDASLSATQLGITLASLGLGWFAEPVFASLLEHPLNWLRVESPEVRHSISFAIGFSVITFAHIVAGELAPKSLAIQKPVPTTLFVALPLEWFRKVTWPAIWALNGTSMWILRKAGLEPVSESELVHSEEEIRLLFTASQKQGRGTALGRSIVLNALDLRRRVAREVMRPRKELVMLSTGARMEGCLELAERTRYSRFPLCVEDDVDQTVGVVHVKDLYAWRTRAATGDDLRAVARKLIYVPENCRLERLLELFLDRRLHMAIVVDEYGGTVGMVTLENILEELVGQIQDEFDQEAPMLERISEDEYVVSGALPAHDLEELVRVPLQSESATTSGFVTARLGGFPKVGDIVVLGAFELRVEQIAEHRVERVRLVRRALPPGPVGTSV